MKNILMIATGGTIASKEGDLGLTPAVTGEELAASVPGIKDICHLEILQLMNIDSTNMRPRQWLMIRDAIMENYNHYDGFVILHGTDTMAYTAGCPVLSHSGQCKADCTHRFPETDGQSLYRCEDQSVPEHSVCCRRSFLQCLHCI